MYTATKVVKDTTNKDAAINKVKLLSNAALKIIESDYDKLVQAVCSGSGNRKIKDPDVSKDVNKNSKKNKKTNSSTSNNTKKNTKKRAEPTNKDPENEDPIIEQENDITNSEAISDENFIETENGFFEKQPESDTQNQTIVNVDEFLDWF